MTVSEIAKELKITVDAVRKRIETAGIKPITREAIYDKKVIKLLGNVKMGRPPKAKAPETKPASTVSAVRKKPVKCAKKAKST